MSSHECSSSSDLGTKIALAVVSLLLTLSETLAVNKKIGANGIVDGLIKWGKSQFGPKSTELEKGEAQPPETANPSETGNVQI